jgi:hypothetical protein
MGLAAPFGFVLSLTLPGPFERPKSKGGLGVTDSEPIGSSAVACVMTGLNVYSVRSTPSGEVAVPIWMLFPNGKPANRIT